MTAEQDAFPGARPRRRAPQQLLFSFLGSLVLDRGHPPISSRVFLHLLEDLGVAEAAGRATLARMTRKGLLARTREGRTARFSLTPWAEDLLREATPRVTSHAPFTHPGGEWTLLSYSMPESRRDLRHQIRARLIWAGFGGLRDGLWIAPGRVDIDAIFDGPEYAGLAELADAFYSVPVEGTDVPRLLHRAWDVRRSAPSTSPSSPPGRPTASGAGARSPASPCSAPTGCSCCAPTPACPPSTSRAAGGRRVRRPVPGAVRGARTGRDRAAPRAPQRRRRAPLNPRGRGRVSLGRRATPHRMTSSALRRRVSPAREELLRVNGPDRSGTAAQNAHSPSFFALQRASSGRQDLVDFCIPCNPYFPTPGMFSQLSGSWSTSSSTTRATPTRSRPSCAPRWGTTRRRS